MKWFTHEQTQKTALAHGFNQIIDDFLKKPHYMTK